MNKDESIDPLLRRTAHTRAGTPPQGDCLDAETLAAWTDGSLTAVQRSAAETHAADCDRCLSVLAAIARTNPPPSATQRPAWLSFRWLVPLTTAAVAITAWILIQEPPRPSPPPAATAAAPAVKPAEPTVARERDVNEQARAGRSSGEGWAGGAVTLEGSGSVATARAVSGRETTRRVGRDCRAGAGAGASRTRTPLHLLPPRRRVRRQRRNALIISLERRRRLRASSSSRRIQPSAGV